MIENQNGTKKNEILENGTQTEVKCQGSNGFHYHATTFFWLKLSIFHYTIDE